jgi:AAA ATPase domain
MPTFPTYDGELPSCLNPWNPRHYLLTLYWVYFRPTALKCYLYQADPELYREHSLVKSLTKVTRNPAYKNLWITSLFTTILVSASVMLIGDITTKKISPHDFSAYWFHGISSYSFIFIRKLLVIATVSFLVSLVVSTIRSFISGIAAGINFGVTGFVLIGIGLSCVFSSINVVVGTVSIAATFGVISGPVNGVILSILFGIIYAFTNDVVGGLMGGILFIVMGALRGPFYLGQLLTLPIFRLYGGQHPIVWDELGVLPLPGSEQYLSKTIKSCTEVEFDRAIQAFGNPFKLSIAQRVCCNYLHNVLDPVSLLFQWSLSNKLSQYAAAPSSWFEWYDRPSIRHVVFAELNHQFISLRPIDFNDRPDEKFVYNLTKPFRNNAVTPLTDFAGIFYRLFTHDEETDTLYDLLADRPIYTALTHYPYGTEIAESFETIGQSLTYDTLEAIATAEPPAPRTDNELRPTILQTLHDFHLVRQEIHTAIIATSNTNRLRSIALANDRLDQLQTYITEEVLTGYPEHKLLLRITRQWQDIIIQAGASAARHQLLTPVSNPYVAGNPVTGKLFVGRDDILQRIEELWTQLDQISSIVLYGHRRMGKTSILRNLPGRFGPHTHIIDFNLQRVGMIDQLADLIYRLAIELHDALPSNLQTHIPEPTEDQYYNTNNPTTQLDRLLKQIQTHRQTDRFILAIDEFEILEDLITQGKIEPTIIAYLRALIQTYPWFILIFAGLHTLQEMTENYWNPLFGSVTRIPVSTLSPASAYQLITNPTDDFPLDYDQDAIDRIIQLSGGQPYLTQLLCQSLITRFNRIRFEERREIEPRFTLADVETIVANPDFYRDGNAYFSALWDQATETHAPTQHLILRALTLAELTLAELTLAELTDRLPNSNLQPALQTLLEHDVIALESDRYSYRVELLRLWVDRQHFG